MSDANHLKGRGYAPIMCTYQDLRTQLLPFCEGYKWGEGTIHDLWKRLSPTPNSIVGTPGERRIVAPNHLGEWLLDVLKWRGVPSEAMVWIYADFMNALEGRKGV